MLLEVAVLVTVVVVAVVLAVVVVVGQPLSLTLLECNRSCLPT